MIEKIFHLKRYLSYLSKAKYYQGHGIHSPFLYALATEVIFKKRDEAAFSYIEKYVNQLKLNHSKIEIIDRGAGSKILHNKKRKISSIARQGITRRKYGIILSQLVNYLKPVHVIELGTSLGIGTIYLASAGRPETKIYTIEAEDSLYYLAMEKFKSIMGHIIPIHGEFDKVLPELLTKLESVDMVYIDGNHRKAPTLRYFQWILKKKNPDTVIVFDDIHWSNEMEEAWNLIISNPEVKLSIDLFQFGIVFFRKEVSKEHYTILF